MGYKLFPLADTAWDNSFQNTMHYAIIAVIVFSYIVLSIFLAIGLDKTKTYPKMTRFLKIFSIIFVASGFFAVLATLVLPLWLISGTVQSALSFAAYTFVAIILSSSFTTLYKYTKNILLCILSHAWFNGCIGLAVYIGSEGYLLLNLNWKVYMVFILELIISVILGMKYIFEEIKQSKHSYDKDIGNPIV